MFLKNILRIKNTLLFHLTILYAGIFTLSSLVMFTVFYYKIYSVTMEDMDQELREEITEYFSVIGEEGIEGVKAKISEETESEDPDAEFIRLVSFDGEVLASTDMSSWDTSEADKLLINFQHDKSGIILQTQIFPGRDNKARIISAVIGPNVILQAGETLEPAENYLQIFRNWFLMLQFVVMALSALIGWFMAKRALLDMEEVTKTATEISNGAYDKRVQVKERFEEIKRLGGTFNNMLDRIQSLFKSMSEINDNIAHELRSPITRIRGIAEMNIMNKKIHGDSKNMAASIIEECDNLIDITNTMLDITETESGVSKAKIEEVNLVKLVLEACELFHPLADEKHINLVTNLPEKLDFRSDRKKLQRIVSNLLENAIKYTPEGGTVTVLALKDNRKVEINIDDTGIGISESDLPHVFDRFYRCDVSRSSEGIGLGLSLAKALTEALNGIIVATSPLNKGSRFTVTFPQ